jgi:hypothetical protein
MQVSVVGRPVNFSKIIRCKFSTVERTGALAILGDFIDTLLAEQMPTRQEHLHVVAVLRAASTCHLWPPQLVLHANNVLVEDTLSRPTLPHLLDLGFLNFSVCFVLTHL